jgi:hypothetical protein
MNNQTAQSKINKVTQAINLYILFYIYMYAFKVENTKEYKSATESISASNN